MSDDLMYFPTDMLVKGCCNGDIDVHHPVTIENRVGDKRTEMLFVDHLLNNSKTDNVPYINVLSGLRSSIKNEMGTLIEDNSFVKHLVDTSIKEWRKDISPYELFHSDIDDDESIDSEGLFDYSKLETGIGEVKDTKNKIKDLEKYLDRKRKDSINGTIDYSEEIDTDIRDLHNRTSKCDKRITSHLNELITVKDKLDPNHMKILMDLGMKNKSSYMQFFKDSGESPVTFYLNDKNSMGIPKNIQSVFTNYTLINNMIHKELDYIEYRMRELKKVSDENNEIMRVFVSGLSNNEHIHEMHVSDEDDANVTEETEDDLIKNIVVTHKKSDSEDTGESLLSKLSSYFSGEEEQRLTEKDRTELASLINKKNMSEKPDEGSVLFADAGDDDDY